MKEETQTPLFALLAAIHLGVLGVHFWLAAQHEVLWTATGVVAVFVVWVAALVGPSRFPVLLVGKTKPRGSVSEDGVSGFGLPAGNVLRWPNVSRVVLANGPFHPERRREP